MRLLLLIFFFNLSFLSLFAQIELPPSCPSDVMQKELLKDPAFFERNQLIEKHYRAALKKAAIGVTEMQLTIPVVVHIMHGIGQPIGKEENINNSQIESAIQYLNEAYANIGDFAGNQPGLPAGDPRQSVNVEIDFCLAQQDPSGNPTNGINRVATTLTTFNKDAPGNSCTTKLDGDLKDLSRWNPNNYLNLWVVREICSNSGCGVAGFAYYPSAHGLCMDGAVVEAKHFGTTANDAKVLVHEIGHYLNLWHTHNIPTGQNACDNSDCVLKGDFVCDTPPANGSNYTNCSTPGSTCSTDATSGPFNSDVPDLIADYMAYSFSSCQNTFTSNQKTRMRAALQGTRQSLLSSPGCDITGDVVIYFKEDGVIIPESSGTSGPAAADCRLYIDYPIELKRYGIPGNSVTVNVSSTDNDNATAGVDYALIQTSATFLPGETSKTITLRVYNDKSPEPNYEGMILSLSGANTGFNNTMIVKILDDDNLPVPGRPVIYQTDFSTSGSWTMSSFGGGTWTIGAQGGNCTTGSSAYATNNSGWPIIYSPANGINQTDLQLAFDYVAATDANNKASIIHRLPAQGSSFLLAQNLQSQTCGTAAHHTYNFPASFEGQSFDFGFAWQNNGNATQTFTVDNVEITSAALPLASSIVSSEAYLGPNATTVFYSPSGDLMAQINNLTNFDYGCTTVEIDGAGTGGTLLPGGTSFFTNKTIKITPATNNPNGVYALKLFYTQAEIDGWKLAANDVESNISIMKTPSSMSSANQTNTEAFTTTLEDWGGNFAFFAGNINTGFSGFSVGNLAAGPLPLSLLRFDAFKNNSAVLLEWETLSEKDFSHFEVAHSIDGFIYTNIDRLASKGNASNLNRYQIQDLNPEEGINYYRLKMVDLDGQYSYSPIVSVEFIRSGISNIYPNPVITDEFTVSYKSANTAQVKLQIVNVLGQVLYQGQFEVEKGENQLIVPAAQLPQAMYNLILQKGSEKSSFRFWHL